MVRRFFSLTFRRRFIEVFGHLEGLRPQQIKRLEKLYSRKSSSFSVVSPEFARTLCELTAETGRQTAVLFDRSNTVQYVIIGGSSEIVIPVLSRYRITPGGLRGLRLVHTHTGGEDLTDDDLTDLALLRLDSVTVLHGDSRGIPLRMQTAYLLPPDSPQMFGFLEDTDPHRQDTDYPDFISALEKEIEDKTKALFRVKNAHSAILVGSYRKKHDAEEHMAELQELTESAGMDVLDIHTQIKPQIHPKYVMGPGRLKEVVIRALQTGADFIVFDNSLSPAQSRAVSEFTELKVLDRTQLILDIFARRAKSNEGKIRVELAQLKYILPRLSGRDDALSRLTGGIGGRGPGETKLEIDKRRINDRIAFLSKKLEKIEQNRTVQRSRRNRGGLPIVSIVGYTNAGKSTLLNNLTQSEVYSDDLMFATLDTSSKRIRFPEERDVIITDTVGFIRDLPENLKGAFKSTLEELNEADLLVHVVDISNHGFLNHIRSVETVLAELGLTDKKIITVLNKTDLLPPEEAEFVLNNVLPDTMFADARLHSLMEIKNSKPDAVYISALDRKTFRLLLERIRFTLFTEGKGRDIPVENYFDDDPERDY
ncbi:MAG: GTPase HflX [Deferribacterales bacterium]